MLPITGNHKTPTTFDSSRICLTIGRIPCYFNSN